MTATAPRVEPVPPPFPPELQAVFDRIMPPGVPLPCRQPPRPRAGLTPPPRDRDQPHPRCGCAYEWGVHVAFFAQQVALTPEQIRATVRGDADDSVWSEEEKLLIRMVDELHDSANLSDEVWNALAATFSVEQIFELIVITRRGLQASGRDFANKMQDVT